MFQLLSVSQLSYFIQCVLLREETVSVSNSAKPIVLHKLLNALWIGNLET